MSFIYLEDGKGLNYSVHGDITSGDGVVFLHGIMGNHKNLRSFVEKFLASFPHYSAVIFDLRNHGSSSKSWTPFSVQACAQDIAGACSALNFRPTKIIGHSFGGKVGVLAADRLLSVDQVWLLDCPPGSLDQAKPLFQPKSHTAIEVIEALQSISWPQSSRKNLIDLLLSWGLNRAVAAWMTTNLDAREDGLYLVFEPADIKAMIKDFIALDCWPLIKKLHQRVSFHLLAAESGQRVSDRDREQITEVYDGRGDHFHELKNSGHLVHIDNPHGLLQIMAKFF